MRRRAQSALARARDEARKQAATFQEVDTALFGATVATLQQVFEWQKQSDARNGRTGDGGGHSHPGWQCRVAATATGKDTRSLGRSATAEHGIFGRCPEVLN